MAIEKDKVSGQRTTGHEWDGIKELDTPTPKVVIWAYVLSAIFVLAGWALYPSIPFKSDFFRGYIGVTSRDRVLEEVRTNTELKNAFEQELLYRNLTDLVNDPDVQARHEAAAAVLFVDNCAVCHGRDLKGQRGFPNLTDHAWLFGSDLDEIEKTIRYGINALHDETRISNMPAFGRDEILDRDALVEVTEFVLSLSGTSHDRELANSGAAIFAENCSSCHGEIGDGIVDLGAPNLRDDVWIYDSSRQGIGEVLYQGGAGVMPAWDGRLTDAEIRKLVLYLNWSRGNGKDAS
jgi:cytochrome c oxidase cbb3-type subunit 3